VSVGCNAGERLIAGGTNTAGVGTEAAWSLNRAGTVSNTWTATARNETGEEATLIVQAICLQAG
jgi:hypothetical protein